MVGSGWKAAAEKGRSGERRYGTLDEMHETEDALSMEVVARICGRLLCCLERVRWEGRRLASLWTGYCQWFWIGWVSTEFIDRKAK